MAPDDANPTARLDDRPASDPEGRSPDREALAREFWVQVAVFNVALLGLGVGLLLVAFERRLEVGGAAVAVGLLALLVGWRRYRRVRRKA